MLNVNQKILVVCTANLQRSPTLEDMLNNTKGYEAKSAGTHPPKDRQKLTKELAQWADIIVFFEIEQYRSARRTLFTMWNSIRVRNLDIPDDYARNEEALIAIIRKQWFQRTNVWLNRPASAPDNSHEELVGKGRG